MVKVYSSQEARDLENLYGPNWIFAVYDPEEEITDVILSPQPKQQTSTDESEEVSSYSPPSSLSSSSSEDQPYVPPPRQTSVPPPGPVVRRPPQFIFSSPGKREREWFRIDDKDDLSTDETDPEYRRQRLKYRREYEPSMEIPTGTRSGVHVVIIDALRHRRPIEFKYKDTGSWRT